MGINEGDIVDVEYTGRLETGEVFDTSEGRGPLTFEVGARQVVPGFEKGVLGMEKGETRTITIAPEEGYGARDERLVRQVPRADIAVDDLQPGHVLALQSQEGHEFQGVVQDVDDEQVTLDFNHFLAGRTLEFDIQVVDVKKS